jgi:hypothetical protein
MFETTSRINVLARRALGREVGSVDVRGGLVTLAAPLGEEDDATLVAGEDTDGLFQYISSVRDILDPPSIRVHVGVREAYLVGNHALVLPRISELLQVENKMRVRTLRLYWFFRLSGSRENDTPPVCALLTIVALLPPV